MVLRYWEDAQMLRIQVRLIEIMVISETGVAGRTKLPE